jgi:HEAT repeat protein
MTNGMLAAFHRTLASVIRHSSFVVFAAVATAADIPKLAEQLAAGDRDTRREASHQLLQLGHDAKPALAALIKALDDEDRQVWSNSIAAIAAIGPDAKDAIPRLIESLDSRKARGFFRRGGGQVPYRSAHALAQIGDAAKPALLESLKSEDTGIRLGAARALGAMRVTDAIPGLIENLGHSDLELRTESGESLGMIGPTAVNPLIASLASPEAQIREGSARALALIGKDAAPAAGALLKMAADEKDPGALAAALTALSKVGIEHERIVPVLVAAFTQSDESVQRAATNALLMVRPAAKVAVPAVTALLNDANHASRAATTLGRYGAEAKSSVPALLRAALKSQPPAAPLLDAVAAIGPASVPAILASVEKLDPAHLNREHWAIHTLVGIGIPALPQLEKALASQAVSVRLAAIGTINELGEDARDARAAVLKLAGDSEPAVRATVLSALVSLGVKPQQALETLDSATRDKAPIVRLAAATAAGAIGPQARPLAARIGEMLDDADQGVRAAALRAIAAVGAGDAALVQKVIARLEDPVLRPTAIEALGKLGSTAPEIGPKLAALYPAASKAERLAILGALASASDSARAPLDSALKDPDPELRAAGLRALAAGQLPPDALVPILAAALADGDPRVRHAATALVGEIGERHGDKLTPLAQPLIELTKQDADRAHALDALREMRIRNLDALTSALSIPVVETKTWAIERLGRLGRDARPVREKIEPLLTDGNDYVRRAARRALDAIGR